VGRKATGLSSYGYDGWVAEGRFFMRRERCKKIKCGFLSASENFCLKGIPEENCPLLQMVLLIKEAKKILKRNP